MVDVNNGRFAIEFEPDLTVRKLLSICLYTAPQIAVFVNGVLVGSHEYDSRRLSDGDTVRVLHMVAGG